VGFRAPTQQSRPDGAASEKEKYIYLDLLGEKFLIGSHKPSQGGKYVGTRIHWSKENIIDEAGRPDVLTHVFWEQGELSSKYVDEFRTELRSRTGRELKSRSTPAPATDIFVPERREDEEKRAAEYANTTARAETGVFAKDRLTWLNRLAYLRDHTRGDTSVAVLDLQSVPDGEWTTYHDRKLI